MNCPKCEEKQFSVFDLKYLEQNNNCWSCDYKKWKKDDLSLEDFERREKSSNIL